ncbi:MAG: hypothetical protein V2I66_07185, partial [Halieaceae bacterium]|nr:hypothetical protein [Halieaceae bacterium]
MNDDELDKQIQQGLNGELPPPDPAAKRRAIAMAREAFVAEHAQAAETIEEKEKVKASQGFWARLRLILGQRAEKEGTMSTYNPKLMYSGVATAAVMAVAVGLALQTQTGREVTIELPEVTLGRDDGPTMAEQRLEERDFDDSLVTRAAEPEAEAISVPETASAAQQARPMNSEDPSVRVTLPPERPADGSVTEAELDFYAFAPPPVMDESLAKEARRA